MNNASSSIKLSGLGFGRLLAELGKSSVPRGSVERVLEMGFWRERPNGLAQVIHLDRTAGSTSTAQVPDTVAPR